MVGAWIAGIYDGDKIVTRAAQEALQRVFPSPEKQANLTKAYQVPILEFVRGAALEETPKTLSDERTTTVEDSDAKYFRLVSSSIAVCDSLLTRLPEADIQKHASTYDELVTAKGMWDFLSSKDSAVRRAVLRLLRTALAKRKGTICALVFQPSHAGVCCLKDRAT